MIRKSDKIWKYSNPIAAQRMAHKYLGPKATLYRSKTKNKKYAIIDPKNNKLVNFGEMGYEDYTKHKDKSRRKNYLRRSSKIKGTWKKNKYSANNLSRHVLW
jgi:hypothetical protein